VDVDLSIAGATECAGAAGAANHLFPSSATAIVVPVVSLTHPGDRPAVDFRIMQFNTRRFSVKTPNFSLFLLASQHTSFNTLHTSLVDSHKLQVVKLAWPYAGGGGGGAIDNNNNALPTTTGSAFALCSPILMHLGSIRGLHTTQVSEDTVLAVYIRGFRDVSSLHLANIYVGNAHAAH